jgi:hypothetical protein
MPAPANDDYANATVITGASGTAGPFNNNGAYIETGEPGHFKYNPGPVYPTGQGTVGPFNTVWFSWSCPANGNYLFSVTGNATTPITFPATINVGEPDGTYVTGWIKFSRTAGTLLLDQSVGDGDGVGYNASIAFAAVTGQTYLFQIDTRIANQTGNFILTWGPFNPIQLGGCGTAPLNFNTNTQCLASLQIPDVTATAYTSFGTFSGPGVFAIRWTGGNAPTGDCGAGSCLIVDGGNFTTFQPWSDPGQNSGTTAFATGTVVIGGGVCAAGVALRNIPCYAFDGYNGPYWVTNQTTPGTGEFLNPGGIGNQYTANATYAVGDYWSNSPSGNNYTVCIQAVPAHQPDFAGATNGTWTQFYTINAPTTICSEVQLPAHPAGQQIGIANFAGSGTNSPQTNPLFQLVYYPMTTANVYGTSFSLTGSGSPWSINVTLRNSTNLDFSNTTVALLNTGGISSASAAQVLDLPATTNTTTGNFTFNATPGLVTATFQISRNGVVVGTISYPLYPVFSVSLLTNFSTSAPAPNPLTDVSVFCYPPLKLYYCYLTLNLQPPQGSLPTAWNTVGFTFSVTSGSVSVYEVDPYYPPENTCAPNASLSGTMNPGVYPNSPSGNQLLAQPGFAVTGAVQSLTVQCLLTVNGAAYPTFTQTIGIPAT